MKQPAVNNLTPQMVAQAYAENQRNAKRSQICLLVTAFLGFYTVLVTWFLVGQATSSLPLLTFQKNAQGDVGIVYASRNPPVTDRQAVHWATDKVSDLLSLHFRQYVEQINRRKNYFVGDGWVLYQQSLIDRNVINQVTSEGLIITAINKGTPRLVKVYEVSGKKNWQVDIEILQTIQGASDKLSTTSKKVTVVVEETRRDEAIEGLKIKTFYVVN